MNNDEAWAKITEIIKEIDAIENVLGDVKVNLIQWGIELVKGDSDSGDSTE